MFNAAHKDLYYLACDRFIDSYSPKQYERVYSDFEERINREDVFNEAEKKRMRRDYKFWWHIQGLEPEEYFSRALYTQPYKVKNGLVSRWRQNIFQYNVNKRTDCSGLDDKAQFNRKYSKYLKREWILTKDVSLDTLSTFIEKENEVIAKPLNGSGGKGIFKINWNTISDKEKESTLNVLMHNEYIIESVLKQKGYLHDINVDSVNTVRVNTLLENGQVSIISVGLRTGIKGQVTDNMHAGGIFWQVNPKTGEIGYGSRSVGKPFNEHPDSKIKVTGSTIPRFDEAVQICKEAQLITPNIPQIGWDVVISEDFVALIEGNSGAGISNILNSENLWKRLKKYLYKNKTDIVLWY